MPSTPTDKIWKRTRVTKTDLNRLVKTLNTVLPTEKYKLDWTLRQPLLMSDRVDEVCPRAPIREVYVYVYAMLKGAWAGQRGLRRSTKQQRISTKQKLQTTEMQRAATAAIERLNKRG